MGSLPDLSKVSHTNAGQILNYLPNYLPKKRLFVANTCLCLHFNAVGTVFVFGVFSDETLDSIESKGVLRWCQRQELNLRPKAYESSALPLSYSGM